MTSLSTFYLLVKQTVFKSDQYDRLLKDVILWVYNNLINLNIVKHSISILANIYNYAKNIILRFLGVYKITLTVNSESIAEDIKEYISKKKSNYIKLVLYDRDKIYPAVVLDKSSHYILFKKHIIYATILDDNKHIAFQLSTYSRDKMILNQFIEIFKDKEKEKENQKVLPERKIYEYDARIDTLEYIYYTRRDLESIFIDPKIKDLMVNDLKAFFDPEVVDRFSKWGRIHKKGYLLYGPPGTGKTSFIRSLASEFQKDIYRVTSTSDLELGVIKRIFKYASTTCAFIVFEDIDTLFCKESKFTFSDIINLLDGLASMPNVILFFTTNHIDRLDPALIRPGRIDIKILLDYASEDTIRQLCSFYSFKPIPEEVVKEFVSYLAANKIKLTPAHCTQILMNYNSYILTVSNTEINHLQILIDNIQISDEQS